MLERWRERDVFARQIAQREGAPLWSFNEGPPTANGRPGLPSRPLPRLQGHLSPLPGDDRPPGPSEGGLGLPRAPGRARGREGARDRLQGRDRGLRDRRVQPALPRVGLPLRRGLEPAHRADRLLDRPRRPLRDDGERLHRVGLVGPAADLGRRASLRGPQGRPLLPEGRHRALLARGRARLPRRRGPLRLREAPDPRAGPQRSDPGGPARAGRPAAGLDDDALDPDLERGGRRRSRDRVRPGPPRGRGLRPRSGAGRARPRRGGRGARPLPRRGARRHRLRAALRLHHRLRPPRPHGPARRLRLHRRGHRARPHRDRLRRGRLPPRRAVRDHPPEPGHPRGHLRRAGHRLRRPQGQGGRPRHRQRAGGEGEAAARRDLPARLSALLALRHAADLLREVELVRGHHPGPRPDARRQRGDRLAPRAHQARPLRQVAGGQRRLGALPRPLLGHPAADLGVRGRGLRPALLRRLDRGPPRPRRRGPRRPPPPLHRRGGPALRSRGLRRGDAQGRPR